MLSLLIGAFVGSGALTYAATASLSFTTTIEPGSMVETASYTVFKDGSTYYAKNGTTGAIDYSGANASQITQNVFDACSNDVKDSVYIKGDLTFTQGLILTKRIMVKGDCRITYSGSGSFIKIDGSDLQVLYAEICDLHIILDSENSIGIHLYNNTYYCDISDIWISSYPHQSSNIGVLLEAATSGVYWNRISNLRTSGLGTGIQLKSSGAECPNANEIYAPIIRESSVCGINITDGYSTRIMGGRIEHDYADSEGVWINDGGTCCMGLSFELKQSGSNAYVITANAGRTEIFGGEFNVYAQYIIDDGTNTHVYSSKFQSSGSAEASNDDWIAHELTGLNPTVVLLTVNETDTRYIIQLKATNTTHFQIYLYDEGAGALETTDKTILWYASVTKP